MRFRPFNAADAHAVSQWTYGGRFALYSMRPEDAPDLLLADYRYHAGLDDQGIVGFYCAGPDAQVPGGRYLAGEPAVVDFGVGLQPARVGRGLGRPFTAAALAHVAETLKPEVVRVTIADFNERSLAVFEGLGFVSAHRFRRDDGLRFTQLERTPG